jgi:ribosome-binding protein aMBF1 (putative translation factor)
LTSLVQLRVSSVFPGCLLQSPLTLLVPGVNLGTSQVSVIGRTCAADLALAPARIKQLMATMTAPLGPSAVLSPAFNEQMNESQRQVLRCTHCRLVQFRTASANCRRCKRCIEIERPAPAPAPLALVPQKAEPAQGLQVAAAVRDLRHVRNLSQRQLAARMNVPRTYISKIENGKAMPTLSSLNRLANALEVEMSSLLRDATTRHSNEIFLNHVRELAAGRRRTA